MIGTAISAAAVTFFAIGFKLAFYARELLRAMARVVEPASGQMFGLGDREGIRRLLTRSVRVMLLFASPILVYLLVVGKALPGAVDGAGVRTRLVAGPPDHDLRRAARDRLRAAGGRSTTAPDASARWPSS